MVRLMFIVLRTRVLSKILQLELELAQTATWFELIRSVLGSHCHDQVKTNE